MVQLSGQGLDEVRLRVQQETLGHGGRKGDPLFKIRLALRCGIERLTQRQRDRVTAAIDANEAHLEVLVAWLATHELRSAFRHKDLAEGRRIAEHVLASLPSCPTPRSPAWAGL